MAKIDFGKYFTPKTIINLSVLLGFLVFVVLIISFLGKEISDKTLQISTHRGEIEGRIMSISRLAELREAAQNAEPALLELRSLLPKQDELVAFPRYIENLANNNDLESRFEFRGGDVLPSESTAGSSPFYLSVTGSYRNIGSFVEALEGGQFIITINTFDVVSQRESTSYRAEIQGQVYFRD